MQWTAIQWGELLSLLIMAFALGLDAFSLGLGVGIRDIRIRQMILISAMIGLFHVIMPMIGVAVGHTLSHFIGDIASYMGGLLLLLLGIHMVWSSFKDDDGDGVLDPRSWLGLFVFSFTVSIDSLSVGFSLGLFETNIWLTVTAFGLFGGFMSLVGLFLGRHAGQWLGGYGEAFGGLILVTFGIKILV